MKKENQFVIGVDGGGTKTIGVLADFKGKILKKIEIGSTNPNKIGFKRAVFNLKKLISRISENKKIKVAYLGLAGGLERDEEKKEKIKREIQKFFNFPIIVDGDQKIAFRAGTNEKDGIVVIAGTGAIAMGWKGKKVAISGGWDWLIGDQGSAFWVGKKVLEEIGKILDGRRKDFELRKFIFKKLKIKKEIDLYKNFYCEDFVTRIASISKFVDEFSKKGDRFSKEILIEAAKEVSKMAISVIKKLNFEREEFPVVFTGGMFKSKIFRGKVEREIKKTAKKAKFILLRKKPVIGAMKLAKEKAIFLQKLSLINKKQRQLFQ
jgi:N-acetylglucosamine kinase-like BadF-type ATPase